MLAGTWWYFHHHQTSKKNYFHAQITFGRLRHHDGLLLYPSAIAHLVPPPPFLPPLFLSAPWEISTDGNLKGMNFSIQNKGTSLPCLGHARRLLAFHYMVMLIMIINLSSIVLKGCQTQRRIGQQALVTSLESNCNLFSININLPN